MTTTSQSFQIPVGRINDVRKELTKLQDRARKINGGNNVFSFAFDAEIRTAIFTSEGNEEIGHVQARYQYQLLTVEQDIVIHEGWMPIARVDVGAKQIESFEAYNKEIDNLGDDYLYSNHCDHCNRNQIIVQAYIMQKGAELMRVGKGCMKSLAPANASAIARSFDVRAMWSAYLNDMTKVMDGDNGGGEWYGGGSYEGNIVYDKTQLLMALKYALEKTNGWVTSSYDERGKVSNMGLRTFDNVNLYSSCYSYLPDATYIKAINDEFALYLSECTNGVEPELVSEIKNFAENTKVRMIDIFLVKKVESAIAKMVKRNSMRGSEYVGTVGNKITVKANLVDTRTGMGSFGPWTMYIFKDELGNMYKKFGTVADRFKMEDGSYKFTAPVKGHEVFDEIKYTVLGGPFSKYK